MLDTLLNPPTALTPLAATTATTATTASVSAPAGGTANRLLRRLRWAADWRSLLKMYRPDSVEPDERGGIGVTRLEARLRGRRYPVHVRAHLGELDRAERTFCEDSDWRLPMELVPRTILDIGAGIGLTTMYFAARYPWARVVAFEPRAEHLPLLRANTAAFGERVTIIPRALAHRRGWLRLAGDAATDEAPDAARVGDADALPFDGIAGTGLGLGTGPRVQATTLRRVLPGLRLDAIDIIKLHAPGHETAILRGAPPDLLNHIRALIVQPAGDAADLRHALTPTHTLAPAPGNRLVATRRYTPIAPTPTAATPAATPAATLRHAA